MNNCSCNSEGTGFYGSDYKFAVNMTCEGFDMNTDGWVITVTVGCKSISFTPATAAYDSNEDQWYICINTELLGVGPMFITFEAHVPDTDFVSGYRRERVTYQLMTIKARE